MTEQVKQPQNDLLPSRPENSETLASQVVSYLRDLIASQGLRPGDRLPSEAKISAAVGISRPIVREALRTLAATGLIEMAVGKRAQVSTLHSAALQNVIENALITGQADIRHVMEMRRGLEITMVVLAAERCTAERAADLTAIVAEMAANVSNVKNYAELDLRLHLALAEASSNPLYLLLMKACQQIFHTSMVLGMERWVDMSQVTYVQQVHEAIVAAVLAHDPVAASKVMAIHFDDAIGAMFGNLPAPKPRAASEPFRSPYAASR